MTCESANCDSEAEAWLPYNRQEMVLILGELTPFRANAMILWDIG